MKKLKALGQALAVPALVLGTGLAPALISSPAFAATTNIYWIGDGTGVNTGATADDLNNPGNWSTVDPSDSTAATKALTHFADGDMLVFDNSAALTGTLANGDFTTGALTTNASENGVTLAGVEVQSNNTSGTFTSDSINLSVANMRLASDASFKVDDGAAGSLTLPGTLSVDSNANGAVTVDGATVGTPTSTGIKAVTFMAENASQTGFTPVTYTSANVGSLGSPKTITVGSNANLDLTTDLTSAANYSITVNTGGTLIITSGTTYKEKITLNGGVLENFDTANAATIQTLTMSADSYYDVKQNSDLKLATGGTVTNTNCYKLSPLTTSADPTKGDNTSITLLSNAAFSKCTPAAPSGTGAGGTGGTATTTATATPAAPKTPDTGFALVSAHVAPVLATTLAAAGALVLAARRFKPSAKRR